MKKLTLIILLLLPLIGFGQSEKRHRAIIVDSVKALSGGRVDIKDTLLLDSLAVYNTDLSSQYTSRSLVDSAFVGVAVAGGDISSLEATLLSGNITNGTNIIVSSGDVLTTNTVSETTLNAGITADNVKLKDGGVIVNSSTNSKILDDGNTTSSIFFGHFLGANVLADYTISPDDGNFGATSGGEIYGSKGNFDEISLYLNGGAAISAFNFGGGSDGGIQINSSVTTIINPARASIGYSLISMSGNLSAATNAGEIVLGDASTVNVVSDATDRQASIIGSKSSTYNTGVVNSVILGGDGLVASIDNTVYVQDIIMGASSKLLATGIFERDLDAGVVVESVIMIDGNTRFLTGGAIQTEKVAGNTALIQAFDVDGATYVTFATLTANNTPTMDLSPNVTMGGGQIALLPGRSGGQTLNGGTATGENLTLVSTAHATKGKILFGTSGYDEVNNRLGIGTTTPFSELDITASCPSITLKRTDNADSHNIYFRNSANAFITRIYSTGTTNGDFRVAVGPANSDPTLLPDVFTITNSGVTITSGDITVGGVVKIGTNPAATGTIRLPNASPIKWRNAANNADVNSLTVNASNQIILGAAAGGWSAVKIANDAALSLSFFAVSPVTRAGATTDIKDALTSYGLLQGTSASPLNLDGGAFTSGNIKLASGATVTAILDEDNMASNSATALSTQQSIKAYVDSQVATTDTFLEMTDTPSSYASQGGKSVRVNTGATALEFFTLPVASTTVQGLVELANQTEVNAGTGTILAVTADKLNAWPGTVNITKLGTIASGTWSGTTIAVNKGGTGQTSYTNGQLLIGNTTGNTLIKATLTGTTNQVNIANGGGSITLSLPQNIHTGANPSFNSITGTASGGGSAAALRVVSTGPGIEIRQTGAALNEKSWDFLAGGGDLSFRAVNDANNASETWLQIARTGATIDTVTIPNGRFISNETFQAFSATINGSGGFQTVNFPTAFPAGSVVKVVGTSDNNATNHFIVITNIGIASFQFLGRNHSGTVHTGGAVVSFIAMRQS